MDELKTTPKTTGADAPQAKKRPGRRPMTAEEKETAAKNRAAEKAKADNLKPELFIQYQGGETDVEKLVEDVEPAFHSEKKRTLVTSLKLYIKPEEQTAYYVINETFEGKVSLN